MLQAALDEPQHVVFPLLRRVCGVHHATAARPQAHQQLLGERLADQVGQSAEVFHTVELGRIPLAGGGHAEGSKPTTEGILWAAGQRRL